MMKFAHVAALATVSIAAGTLSGVAGAAPWKATNNVFWQNAAGTHSAVDPFTVLRGAGSPNRQLAQWLAGQGAVTAIARSVQPGGGVRVTSFRFAPGAGFGLELTDAQKEKEQAGGSGRVLDCLIATGRCVVNDAAAPLVTNPGAGEVGHSYSAELPAASAARVVTRRGARS
jgi:hypothetical protein